MFQYFLPDWHTSAGFLVSQDTSHDFMQRAQCCFDTEWCQTRLSNEQMRDCSKDIPFYKQKRYLIRGIEIFVCVAALLNLVKFIYVTVQIVLLTGRVPFQDEIEDLAKFEWLFQLVPLRLVFSLEMLLWVLQYCPCLWVRGVLFCVY